MSLVALAVVGCVVFWMVLHLTLNRGPDRIQLATVCLAFALLGHLVLAVQLHQRGSNTLVVTALALFAAVAYVSVGALAICLYRWAWRICLGALALHLTASVLGLALASTLGAAAVVVVAQWFVLGAVALWACLHPGLRSILVPSSAEGAA